MNSPKVITIRRTCGTASCCNCDRGEGCSPVHREDCTASGSRAPGPANKESWLAQHPWIWFWVAFIILLSFWGGFLTIAIKNQPASVPVLHHG